MLAPPPPPPRHLEQHHNFPASTNDLASLRKTFTLKKMSMKTMATKGMTTPVARDQHQRRVDKDDRRRDSDNDSRGKVVVDLIAM